MPPLDSNILALMSSIGTVFVQAIKGLLPDRAKAFIPVGLIALMIVIGLSLAFYYGRDPLAGALEGFFGAAGAIGIYEGANAIPGVKAVASSKGWISRE